MFNVWGIGAGIGVRRQTMRLIDADELPEHKFTRESAKSSDYMRGWNDAIDTIVDTAPTVERPKSKWIPQTDYDGFTYWKCSKCGKKNDYEVTDFCFWCGADMRKEVEND